MPELKKQGRLLRTTAGLEPYTGTFGRKEAAHLLRRTTFAPRYSEITEAVNNGLEWTLNQLLYTTQTAPAPPDAWAIQPSYPRPVNSDQQKDERDWNNELRAWWLQLMCDQGISVREKMTLFWHDHFANESVTVKRSQWMYKQNTSFREFAFGSFERLLNAMHVDPAMLYYLDSRLSTASKPNENYAREVMELFTLGEGHYTEQDIHEAARAFTGWIVENDLGVMKSSRFDATDKTILGRTDSWWATAVTDILLEHAEAAQPDIPVSALFLCRKLYRYFVYEEPDETVVSGMAATLRDAGVKPNRFDVGAVLRQLFGSAHFFDNSHYGGLVKEPMDLIVGAIRQMAIGNPKHDKAISVGKNLGQHLLDPPDVSGWPGYRHWISTSTLPRRHDFTNDLIDGFINSAGNTHTINVVQDVALPTGVAQNAEQLVEALAEYLLPFPLTTQLKTTLLDVLLDGTAAENWDPFAAGAEARIKNTLKVLLALPEYQLA
jgi:uncharacterized protein (DUF1800 family)